MNTGTFNRLLVACVSAVAAAGVASAQGPIVIGNFDSGTDIGWRHFDNGPGAPGAPLIYEFAGGVYRLHSTAAFETNESDGMVSLLVPPSYVDGRLRVRMRCDSPVGRAGIGMRGAVISGEPHGYHLDLYFDPASTVAAALYRTNVSGLDTLLGSVPKSALGLVAGTEYFVELGATGTTITGKVWPRIGGVEPATPQIIATDATYASGGVAVFVSKHAAAPTLAYLDASFDDLWFFMPASRVCGLADVASLGGAAAPDGQLTADDIIVYLDAFFAGNGPIADIASLGGATTPDGAMTADDLIVFLSAFFAGCGE